MFKPDLVLHFIGGIALMYHCFVFFNNNKETARAVAISIITSLLVILVWEVIQHFFKDNSDFSLMDILYGAIGIFTATFWVATNNITSILKGKSKSKWQNLK